MLKKQRACDRCHKQKERCVLLIGASSCELCRETESPCTFLRERRRRGRWPTAQKLGPTASVGVWDIATASKRSGPDVSEDEKSTAASTVAEQSQTSQLRLVFPQSTLPSPFDTDPDILDKFAARYTCFMIGPTFAPQFRSTLQLAYACSPGLLQDILTIFWTGIQEDTYKTSPTHQSNVEKGTAALRILRVARAARLQDAFAIMALTQSLAAFELLTHVTGSPLILQFSLSVVKPWYPELAMHAPFDPVIIGLILWDTVNCLIKRQLPIIKFRPRTCQPIDHVAGLCMTLMPLLYDLCVAGCVSDRESQCNNSETDLDAVSQIQQSILAWTPQLPPDAITSYSAQELIAMKTQASMYKMGALLAAHRLLFPVGSQDKIAASYASSILLELSTYLSLFGSHATLPFVAFPIFMGALEVPDVPSNIWRKVNLLAMAPECAAGLSATINRVWGARHAGCTGCLFDLIASDPDIVIVP
ncbi:hypothetical protein GGR57DRAFT_507290 [Xylariaceae sp. FL1272]|nr:hypothetical protein GGR57DRAFT_507290 [Xylariaceae sp. FL1272]